MSKIIQISGFKGGFTNSKNDYLSRQTFLNAQNLDIFTKARTLTPVTQFSSYSAPTISGGTDVRFTDIAYSSSPFVIGTATISSANNIVVWSTSSSSSTAIFTSGGTGTSASNLVEFKGSTYFGYGTRLMRINTTALAFTVTIATPGDFTATAHGLSSGDTVRFSTTGALPTGIVADTTYYVVGPITADTFAVSATRGGSAINTTGSQSGTHSITTRVQTVSSSLTTCGILRVHAGLGKLFFKNGDYVGWYDGTTISLTTLSLNAGDTLPDMRPHGRFMILGVNSAYRMTEFLTWDGSATSIDDYTPTGDSNLQTFDIVGSEVRAVFATGFYAFTVGSKPEMLYQFPNDISSCTISTYRDLSVFGVSTGTTGYKQYIWAYGSNSAFDKDVLTPYRTVQQGQTNGVAFVMTKFLGSTLYIIHRNPTSDDTYTIEYYNTSAKSDDGIYESPVFELNGGLKGKIEKIIFNHEPLGVSSGFTAQIKLLGTQPWGSTIPAGDAFTVTIASPAVFTKTGHGYVAGDVIRVQSTGLLPTGLSPLTDYYVISTGLTSSQFQVSTFAGGSAVNTSGSQTGTHSIDTYVDLITPQGSGSTTGKTQSTDNASFTEVSAPYMKSATHAQIRVKFDEINSAFTPELIFPILVEVQ